MKKSTVALILLSSLNIPAFGMHKLQNNSDNSRGVTFDDERITEFSSEFTSNLDTMLSDLSHVSQNLLSSNKAIVTTLMDKFSISQSAFITTALRARETEGSISKVAILTAVKKLFGAHLELSAVNATSKDFENQIRTLKQKLDLAQSENSKLNTSIDLAMDNQKLLSSVVEYSVKTLTKQSSLLTKVQEEAFEKRAASDRTDYLVDRLKRMIEQKKIQWSREQQTQSRTSRLPVREINIELVSIAEKIAGYKLAENLMVMFAPFARFFKESGTATLKSSRTKTSQKDDLEFVPYALGNNSLGMLKKMNVNPETFNIVAQHAVMIVALRKKLARTVTAQELRGEQERVPTKRGHISLLALHTSGMKYDTSMLVVPTDKAGEPLGLWVFQGGYFDQSGVEARCWQNALNRVYQEVLTSKSTVDSTVITSSLPGVVAQDIIRTTRFDPDMPLITQLNKIDWSKYYSSATVAYIDITGCTKRSKSEDTSFMKDFILKPFFSSLYRLLKQGRYKGLAPLKPLGDCLMIGQGSPDQTPEHAELMINFILDWVENKLPAINEELLKHTDIPLMVHAGVASGKMTASVVGIHPTLNLEWNGEAGNLGAKLEKAASSDGGSIMKNALIALSAGTYKRLKNRKFISDQGTFKYGTQTIQIHDCGKQPLLGDGEDKVQVYKITNDYISTDSDASPSSSSADSHDAEDDEADPDDKTGAENND